MRRRLVALGLAAALGGCAHYSPAPIAPQGFAAAFDARRLPPRPPGQAAWMDAGLVAAALAGNPRVAEARAKYATARSAVVVARARPAATLTLTAEYASERPHWGYGGAGDFPLDLGGKRAARVTTAELQALQAYYDLGEAAWSVLMEVERGRADILAADREIAAADQATGLRRTRWERLQRRVAAGEDARAVALTAQSELAAAERRASEARGRKAQGISALARALGAPAATVSELVLAPSPEPAPPSAGQLASWRGEAAASRGDILRAVVDYDLAENALRDEVARQYPAVSLGPGYQYDHGVDKLPFNLVLALPPLDLNRSGIGQAEAARAAAGRSLESAQAAALADVDKAAAALAAATDVAARLQAQDLAVARRAADDAARAVRAGESDRTDALAADALLAEAQLAALDAERARQVAVLDLMDTLRHPFDTSQAALIADAVGPPALRAPPPKGPR